MLSDIPVDALARQRRLGPLGAVRHGSRRAENDHGALAASLGIEIQSDRDIGERPIKGVSFALLQVRRVHTGPRRQENGRQNLVRLQIVFTLDVLVRRDEEVLEQHAAHRTGVVGESHRGAQCHQHGGGG